MQTTALEVRRVVVRPLLIGAVAVVLVISSVASASLARGAAASSPKPTVVLVHGAFADASGWSGVVTRLQAAGYPVIAAPNPLRSLHGDSAYIASIIAQTPGLIILVGHSYGGAVITNAGAGNPNVKALVYIDAFIPDVGENTLPLAGEGSGLVPSALEFKGFPPFGEHDIDIYIGKSSFREVFAADVSAKTAAMMYSSQRPAAALTGDQPTLNAAWKTVPSFALIGRQDRAITPTALRFMANRAEATIVEIDSSHVAMISHPTDVTKLILRADRDTN